MKILVIFTADFHSVEFSDWTGNLLFTSENVALNLNSATNVLLYQIQSARKILLSGNQPLISQFQLVSALEFLQSVVLLKIELYIN